MGRTTILALILALSFLGLADSFYLAESAATNTPLICGPGMLDGCNAVAQSPYSKLFGIPLGAYGVIFYGLTLAVTAFAFKSQVKRINLYLVLVTGVGALMSVVFLAIQFFIIKALCVYCVASALISFVIFGLALYLIRSRTPIPEPVAISS